MVDFNIQDSGHSDCIRERPESFGHPSPEGKRKEQSYKTEEHRGGGATWSFSHLLPDKGRHKAHRVTKHLQTAFALGRIEFLELGELSRGATEPAYSDPNYKRGLSLRELFFTPHPMSSHVSPFSGELGHKLR